MSTDFNSGQLVPFGGGSPQGHAYQLDPLTDLLAHHLSAEGVDDETVSEQIARIFYETRALPLSKDLPKPIDLEDCDYKAIVFPRLDQSVEFYLYPKKSKDKTEDTSDKVQTVNSDQETEKGMSKVLKSAIGLKISSLDRQVIVEKTADKVARLVVNLSHNATYSNRKEAFLHEVKLMEGLKDAPEFARLLAWTIYQGPKGIKGVMFQPYYPNGDLAKHLARIVPEISDVKARFRKHFNLHNHLLQILVALKTHGIIDSDLTPANVLLDAKFNPILTDLEFALSSEELNDVDLIKRYLCRGSPEFMAPEKVKVAFTGGYLESADYSSNVWSMGCILHYLYYGKWPEVLTLLGKYANDRADFIDNKPGAPTRPELKAQKDQILAGYDALSAIADKANDDNSYEYLLTMMLHPDPERRYTAEAALQYFTSSLS